MAMDSHAPQGTASPSVGGPGRAERRLHPREGACPQQAGILEAPGVTRLSLANPGLLAQFPAG